MTINPKGDLGTTFFPLDFSNFHFTPKRDKHKLAWLYIYIYILIIYYGVPTKSK